MISLAFGLVLPACQSDQNTGLSTSTKTDTVQIATVNWSDNIIMSHLVKHIIEEEFGAPVSLNRYSLSRAYTNVAQGNDDLFLSSWQPATHRDYIDTYSDQLSELGTNYNGAHIGLAVPPYMDIQSIQELKNIRDQVEGRIIGIENDAGIVQLTEKAIDAYELDYRVVGTSEPAMISTLQASMEKEEPIIITGWKPHWLFKRYELKFLDDPQEGYSKEEKILSVARKGFQEQYPDVAKFLSIFELQESQMLMLMDRIEKTEDNPVQVIHQWLKEHQDIVQGWLDEVDN
jgi:glycine betaine/proline transport system substrate-binding protein